MTLGRVPLFQAPGGLQPGNTVNVIQQPGFGIILGAGQFVDINDLKIMTSIAGTATRYQTFETTIGSAGAAGTAYYVVPTGKRFVCLAMLYAVTAFAATPIYATIGYGDDGVNNSAAAPTNAVGLITVSFVLRDAGGAGANFAIQPEITPMYFTVAAGKYPFANFPQTSQSLTLFGVERPA